MAASSEQLPLASAVGARLRALREAQAMSLSELARAAKVGKATLSELESGRRNATLETLFALTTALGIPLSAILPAPGDAESSAETIHGTAVDATLVARFDDREAATELYRLTIRTGRRQISPGHATGVREHLIVFAGVAVVGPASAPIHLEAGTSGSWTADVDHIYATEGHDDVAAALLMRYPHQ